jgi:hypothetical protein
MNERYGHLVADAGVERLAADEVGGSVRHFVERGLESDQAFINTIENGSRNSNSGGLFDGGVTAAGTRMMAEAPDRGEVQAVRREIIGYARAMAGADAVGDVVDAPPGCEQCV